MTDNFIHSCADYKLGLRILKVDMKISEMVSPLDVGTIQTTMKKTKRDFRKLFVNSYVK